MSSQSPSSFYTNNKTSSDTSVNTSPPGPASAPVSNTDPSASSFYKGTGLYNTPTTVVIWDGTDG